MSHEFDTYAGQGPGYDGPLHVPHGAINPNDYADGHDYQLALAGQHAADERAARLRSRRPAGARCPECEPLPAIGAPMAQWRRPTHLCAEHQRNVDIETVKKKTAYLRLPAVDEATFRRFLRGQGPPVVDGETHHFYDWSGARVAHLLAEALHEADPDRRLHKGTLACVDTMSSNRNVHLMPTGEVVTRNSSIDQDHLGIIKIRKPGPSQSPWGVVETWDWYVRARACDRFNSRTYELLPDERWFAHKEINQLPGLVREARETVAARRAGAEKARAEEQAQARQDRRDNVKMVMYWILILLVVAAVVVGMVWASHAIPHR